MALIQAKPAGGAHAGLRFAGGPDPGRAELLASQRLRRVGLERPLTALRGIGPRLGERASQLGIETIADLVWHLPHAYRDHSLVRTAAELEIGERATLDVVLATRPRVRPTRRRGLRIVEATVDDGSRSLTATWFNQAWLADQLVGGERLLITGRLDRRGFTVETHEPAEGRAAGIHTLGLVPVHPSGSGIRPGRLRAWVHGALGAAAAVPDPLPARSRLRLGLPRLADAIAAVHFPANGETAERARARLAFEELIVHQAALLLRRRRRRAERRARPLGAAGELTAAWLASLPFELTGAQRHALEEIERELAQARPMQRLLMGEVGSGKTVVALYAMLRAVEAGGQAALMAPTETLAEQHASTLERLLEGVPVARGVIAQSQPARRRRELERRLAAGEPCLVVGTHALIERRVELPCLALAVVDEQHRFGVSQRAAFDHKPADGLAPHSLHMSATPIPRTLSLTAYGDLDLTTLDELPAGRRAVSTRVVAEDGREAAYGFVREQLEAGRQAYVVCPLVTESEQLQARAAEAEAERLASAELAGFELGLVHGQMSAERKREALKRFSAGATRALVATSVIEVGIDVPGATLIVIEGSERYGLAQLHQLRGRVGRSGAESHCILVASTGATTRARRRLEALAGEADGFRLAELDLAMRGEGEVLGTLQHGMPRFRAARLPEDEELLSSARAELKRLVDEEGTLESPLLAPLLDAARSRHGDESVEAIAA